MYVFGSGAFSIEGERGLSLYLGATFVAPHGNSVTAKFLLALASTSSWCHVSRDCVTSLGAYSLKLLNIQS
jgi:hypothetical protein